VHGTKLAVPKKRGLNWGKRNEGAISGEGGHPARTKGEGGGEVFIKVVNARNTVKHNAEKKKKKKKKKIEGKLNNS